MAFESCRNTRAPNLISCRQSMRLMASCGGLAANAAQPDSRSFFLSGSKNAKVRRAAGSDAQRGSRDPPMQLRYARETKSAPDIHALTMESTSYCPVLTT